MAESQHSATDIITYIGVPLAVLGVLPILYNTVATLAALSRVRRMLRHSNLTALTRSDVVNRVIEVELPRYAVRPMDRFADSEQYWSLSRHRSNIPGGSWTTFNWRKNVIGFSTQRIEYADQLRQPQVEVAFDDLICYLLDLGARPDPQGWRLLRSSGLWTPVGCTLMRAPDGLNSALTIAPLDGSDGHLSLAVTWAGPWTERNASHLPPYWVRLYPAPSRRQSGEIVAEDRGEHEEEDESKPLVDGKSPSEPLQSSESASTRRPSSESTCGGKADASTTATTATTTTTTTTSHSSSPDSSRTQSLSLSSQPITVQISADGIVSALSNQQPPAAPSPHAGPQGNGNGNDSNSSSNGLYIEHLRVRPSGNSAGAWFASAATAYGTTSQTVLWNYKIPDDILAFSRRETVPCGVLVVLGVVDEAATPHWATAYPDDHARQLDAFVQRSMAQREALAAEARMPPAQRVIAERERAAREGMERMREMRERLRIQAERQETRLMEALQSPRWDNKVVAEHNFAWLVSKGEVDGRAVQGGVKEAVGNVLHRMVLDGEFTSRLCRMLDLWKAWAENGGMRKSDLTALQEDQVTFAYATLLVAIIKDTSTALEGTVSMDLQECLRLWRTVRLG